MSQEVVELDNVQDWCEKVGGEYVSRESGDVQWHLGGGMEACEFPDGSIAGVTASSENATVQFQPGGRGYAKKDMPSVTFESGGIALFEEHIGMFSIPADDDPHKGLMWEYKEEEY